MKKRKYLRVIITVSLILAGMILMAYPFISNYSYEHRQKEVIYGYETDMEKRDEHTLSEEFQQALSYNQDLQDSRVLITDPFDPNAVKSSAGISYQQLLNLSGDGLMAYVEIPKISVFLPVFHGTSEKVLQEGVGHLENTSLPVGGESSHAVLSAHSGLSDKKLFTDLVLLEEGNCFYIHVLDQVLAYEIDRIQVVTPDQTEDLQIISGEDHVTLVTCTPYGINSHRLLVRGTRIPYVPEEKEKVQDSSLLTGSPWMRQYVIAVLTGILCGVLILAAVIFFSRRGKNEKKK